MSLKLVSRSELRMCNVTLWGFLWYCHRSRKQTNGGGIWWGRDACLQLVLVTAMPPSRHGHQTNLSERHSIHTNSETVNRNGVPLAMFAIPQNVTKSQNAAKTVASTVRSSLVRWPHAVTSTAFEASAAMAAWHAWKFYSCVRSFGRCQLANKTYVTVCRRRRTENDEEQSLSAVGCTVAAVWPRTVNWSLQMHKRRSSLSVLELSPVPIKPQANCSTVA